MLGTARAAFKNSLFQTLAFLEQENSCALGSGYHDRHRINHIGLGRREKRVTRSERRSWEVTYASVNLTLSSFIDKLGKRKCCLAELKWLVPLLSVLSSRPVQLEYTARQVFSSWWIKEGAPPSCDYSRQKDLNKQHHGDDVNPFSPFWTQSTPSFLLPLDAWCCVYKNVPFGHTKKKVSPPPSFQFFFSTYGFTLLIMIRTFNLHHAHI